MSYAAPCWARNLLSHAVAKLKSAQRVALLFISKAYRTSRTEALNVIASIPPIDLTIVKEAKYHRLMTLGKQATIGEAIGSRSGTENRSRSGTEKG